MKQRLFFWIDLEMTGLDPAYDVILEVACAYTDAQLNNIIEGPCLAISCTDNDLNKMNTIVRALHTSSGLIDDVRASETSLEHAYAQVRTFMYEHGKKHETLLCGNTIWQDRAFLARFMPDIVDYAHYRLVDVSTIKELVSNWYSSPEASFKKSKAHRARADVYESIDELRHYRKYFFVP